MPADDLGSVWSSKPVRVSQAIKSVGKEMDREPKKKYRDSQEHSERDLDSVELSSKEEPLQPVRVNEHPAENDALIPGSIVDLTIG